MKKILNIGVLVLVLCIALVGCGKKDVVEESSNKTKEKEEKKLEKVQKDDELKREDDAVVSGTLEGYKFKVTDKVTDRIIIEMENGDIMLAVLSNKDTPKTIANFKNLVKEHFFDGLTFHRVVKGFMIQSGDPTGTGFGGAEKTIKGEFSANGVDNKLSHTRGVISMARSNDPDSASSQFFICHEDSTFLDGNYAAFGKVFAGMDVVDAIANVEVKGETPVDKPVIKSIRFIELEK